VSDEPNEFEKLARPIIRASMRKANVARLRELRRRRKCPGLTKEEKQEVVTLLAAIAFQDGEDP
jgi:hypothetical protein